MTKLDRAVVGDVERHVVYPWVIVRGEPMFCLRGLKRIWNGAALSNAGRVWFIAHDRPHRDRVKLRLLHSGCYEVSTVTEEHVIGIPRQWGLRQTLARLDAGKPVWVELWYEER